MCRSLILKWSGVCVVMSINKNDVQVCYLCNQPLDGEINVDHVPPRQFYGKAIRKRHNPNLLTLRVHKRCNQQYQHDEDYFVNTLIPLVHDTYAGNVVLRDDLEKYRNRQQVGLMQKVLREFDNRPSGLILPRGKVVKRLDGQRVHRIAWKIVRGLYFYHEGKVLPERLLQNSSCQAIQ